MVNRIGIRLLSGAMLLAAFHVQLLAQTGVENEAIANEIIERINQYRNSQGLRALKARPELNRIAWEHSRNMADGRVSFSHDGFEQRYNKLKGLFKPPYMAAENIYMSSTGTNFGAMAVKGWLNSPGHYKNIRDKHYYTGVGVARNAKGEWYATQFFVGRP